MCPMNLEWAISKLASLSFIMYHDGWCHSQTRKQWLQDLALHSGSALATDDLGRRSHRSVLHIEGASFRLGENHMANFSIADMAMLVELSLLNFRFSRPGAGVCGDAGVPTPPASVCQPDVIEACGQVGSSAFSAGSTSTRVRQRRTHRRGAPSNSSGDKQVGFQLSFFM